MKTLVLGLGNSILSDDGVGLYIARELKNFLNREEITIAEACLGGLGLLDLMVGYDKVIIIDAIQTKEGKVGQIYRLKSKEFNATRHASSIHSVNFTTALELGHQLELAMPQQIVIFAIEVVDISTFSEECTPEVQKAIPKCVEMVLQEINQTNR